MGSLEQANLPTQDAGAKVAQASALKQTIATLNSLLTVSVLLVPVAGALASSIPADLPASAIAGWALLQQKFDDFRTSQEYRRPGKHWIDFYRASGLTDTPKVKPKEYDVSVTPQETVRVTEYAGGGAGRVLSLSMESSGKHRPGILSVSP